MCPPFLTDRENAPGLCSAEHGGGRGRSYPEEDGASESSERPVTSKAPTSSRLCSLDGNLGEMKSTTVPKRRNVSSYFFFLFFFEENLQLTMRYSQAESPTRITRGSSVKEECQSTSYLLCITAFNNVMYNIVIYIFLYRAVVLYTSFIHLRILGNKSRQGRYFILKGKRMPLL